MFTDFVFFNNSKQRMLISSKSINGKVDIIYFCLY